YIRFWDYGGGTGTFSICVTQPPPPPSPPSNDDPCNATILPISTACNYTTATNVNATNTAGPPAPTCASYSGQDVWFSAIVPAGGAINIDSNTGSITDGGMAVYSATSCSGTFTQIACDDDNSINGAMPSLSLTGLTPGQTIYIRFWDFGGGTGTFSICVTEPTPPPPPPSNDDCIGATNLTCGTIGLPGTTALTISESAPGLTSSSYGVWYSFIGNGDNLLVSTTGTGGFDQEMTVMTGSCGAYTILTSLDGASSNGTESYNITTVVGTTYYVYVANYSTSSTTTGTFTISATCTNVPTCTGNTPAGNTCDVATPICDLNGYCGNTSDSYTADYWTQLDNTFCGSIENNSFISFVASSANVTLNVFVESCTYGDGIQMMIYSGGCGSGPITSYACWSPGYETSGTISATGLTIGNSYYLMIDGYAGDICNYIISASSGVQLPVTLNTNNVTICTGSSTNLSVTGGNGTYTWSPNTALSSTSGSIVTANPTSTITYTVSSSTGNPLCPSSTSDQVTVNVIPLPTVTVNSQTVCSGTTSTVSATPNPLGAYNYVWTVPAGVTDPGNVASFTSNIEGNYSVVVSTNATPACSSAQATGSITFINSLSTTVNSQIICQGNSATISATSTPTGTYNYVWTVPSGFLNPGNVSSFATSTAGAYSVVVSTTTSPTCSSNLTTGTITVTPTATSTTNQTICQTALPFSWNGLTFNISGSQTTTLLSSAGCDS
ncbi:MAG: hypothetical protein EBQ94_04220, partial [Flavobacteriales bacterium]|nr:hypothetical protein [Flavobacteriales bacterium]